MTVDFLLSPIEVVRLLIFVGLTGLSVRGGKSRKNHGMEVSLFNMGLSQASKQGHPTRI